MLLFLHVVLGFGLMVTVAESIRSDRPHGEVDLAVLLAEMTELPG
jgi:hypothetical protein